MSNLSFTSIVQALPSSVPFIGPEALERQTGRSIAVRIGANESAFGISPQAEDAMRASVEDLCMYNDPENYELKKMLAACHRVAENQICISAGVDDLLGLMVRIVVEIGYPVVTTLGSYPTFNYHVNGFGGRLEEVPYVKDRVDLQGLLDRVISTGARLVYLANPDNPMGTWHRGDEIQSFVNALPENALAIVDEAYSDFAPLEASWPMEEVNPRVVRMRTFSKAHGLAGARIGYAIAHREVISKLDKVRNHFGVNRVAQAGALASLKDRTFISEVVKKVISGREDYVRFAYDLGLQSVLSATNFVCFDLKDSNRARTVLEKLLLRGVFVRMPSQPPQSRCIRVTVGNEEQRELFKKAFQDVLEEIT